MSDDIRNYRPRSLVPPCSHGDTGSLPVEADGLTVAKSPESPPPAQPTPTQRQTEAVLCPPRAPEYVSMRAILAVGFGEAYITCNGRRVLDGEAFARKGKFVTMRKAENMARKAPECIWQAVWYAPLFDEVYTRQEDGRWKLTHRGPGFA